MQPDTVTLIANFIPFQKPDGGPNFYSFDPNVVYEIHIDNNGDAVEDITYQWRFTTEVRNPATFLYNTGPVTSLDDPDLNVRQFYRLTRIDGPRRTGTVTELSGRLPVPPPNIGPRSTPNYGALGGGIQGLPGNIRVFAGQRDEGFYVDLGIFDLLGVGSGTVEDSTAGFNVSTPRDSGAEVALCRAAARRRRSPSDPNAIIGVWSTASRFATRTLSAGAQTHSGALVQVSRLGNPLVNEAVIDLARKDAFNGIEPTSDAVALDRVTDPEVPKLLKLIFNVDSPPAPRNDLVTIFLTGIPGLNQPANVRAAEMLRLNMAIPPTHVAEPHGRARRRHRRLPERPPSRRRCARHRAAGGRGRDAADAGVQPLPEQHARRQRRQQRRAVPAVLPVSRHPARRERKPGARDASSA